MKGIITTLFLLFSVFAYSQDTRFIVEHPDLFPYLDVNMVDTFYNVPGTQTAWEWVHSDSNGIYRLLWIEKLDGGESTGQYNLDSYTYTVKNVNHTLASNKLSKLWKERADVVVNDYYMFVQDAVVNIYSSSEGIAAFKLILE